MPSPFDHVNHRAHERGKGGSVRDTMMDEAARLSREIKQVLAEDQDTRERKPIWKRLTRRS